MHVHMYLCACVRSMYTHFLVCLCTGLCACVSVFTYVNECMCMCVYVCAVHMRICACVPVHMSAYVYVYLNVSACVHYALHVCFLGGVRMSLCVCIRFEGYRLSSLQWGIREQQLEGKQKVFDQPERQLRSHASTERPIRK